MDQWTKILQFFCLPYPGGKYFYAPSCVSFCQIFNCNFLKTSFLILVFLFLFQIQQVK
jgi:hypothetical protein